MCQITHYRDFHCKHRWASITWPCAPGMGFDTCPDFVDGIRRQLPRRLVAMGEGCPKWCVFSLSQLCLPFLLLVSFLDHVVRPTYGVMFYVGMWRRKGADSSDAGVVTLGTNMIAT